VGISGCGATVEIVEAAVDVMERKIWMSLHTDTPSHFRRVDVTPPEVLQNVSRISIEYHGENGHLRLIGQCENAGFRLDRHWAEGIRGTLEFSRMQTETQLRVVSE
jgi:hypothetical protein